MRYSFKITQRSTVQWCSDRVLSADSQPDIGSETRNLSESLAVEG
jgi:hypothetical protein